MNCPDCGCAVEKAAQFCPKCYARIEPPSFWRRVISFFKNLSKPGTHVLSVKKSVTIKTVGKDGTLREYHSLAEAPLALQQAVEKLESEVTKEQDKALSDALLADSGKSPQSGFIPKKTFSIYRIKDASGRETVYHSIDELPPNIRAAIEKAQGNKD
jgi:hypothetical protein